MKKTLAITITALGAFILILCITFTVVRMTVSRTVWFEEEFEKLALNEAMDMTLGDLGAGIRTLVDYINGRTATIDVLVTVNGQQVRMFNLDIEIVHMAEVKALWQGLSAARNTGLWLGAILMLAGVLLERKESLHTAFWGYAWGLGVFGVLLAFMGTWAAVSFDGFWTAFHRIIFPGTENWMLPENSRMIQMLPGNLFRDLVMLIMGRTLIILLLIGGVLGTPWFLRRRKKQETAQQQQAKEEAQSRAQVVEGPDLLQVHKKANMTVTARNQLNREQEQQEKPLPASEPEPEPDAVKIDFAPYAGTQETIDEPDDDYDDLL